MSIDEFNNRVGEELKKFGEPPAWKIEKCRKKLLGEDFYCGCEECIKKNNREA